MLWYCSTRAPGSDANAAVIGDGSAKWKMVDVAAAAPPDRRTAARRRAGRRRSSARRGPTGGRARRSSSRTTRALSPIASPRCAAGTHWLMIMAGIGIGLGVRRDRDCVDRSVGSRRASDPRLRARARSRARVFRQRPEQRRPELPQLLEPLELIELRPEVPRHLGRGRGGPPRAAASTKRSSVPPKSFAAQPRQRRVLRVEDRLFEPAIVEDGGHEPGDLERILRVVQHAAAVHRRRHGGGRVGEHRHALVERLDDRDAEAFVLAGAEEEIGDVVERGQLLVR